MKKITRRDALISSAAIGSLAVSGCLSRGEGGVPGNGSGGGNGDENSDGLDSGIVDASIETTGSDCGSPDDDQIDAVRGEESITVTGVLPAPNPCHEAVLESSELEDGVLSFVVDVKDATTDDEECIQCHGAIEYEVRFELGDVSAVETVAVDHVTGERHEIEPESGSDTDDSTNGSSPTIIDDSIETVDSDCGSDSDDWIEVDPGEETILVQGVLSASNPCHEAVLEDVAIEETRLSLVVDVRSTLEEGDVCVECVGSIAYEALIGVTDADALDSVHVDHVTGGEHVVSWDSASESDGEGS